MTVLIKTVLAVFLSVGLLFSAQETSQKQENTLPMEEEYDWSKWMPSECYSKIKYRYRCELNTNGKDGLYHVQVRNDYNRVINFGFEVADKPITRKGIGGHGLGAGEKSRDSFFYFDNDMCSGNIYVAVGGIRFDYKKKPFNFVPCDDGSINKHIPAHMLNRN